MKLPGKSKVQLKYDLNLRKQDECKEKFSVEVKNRFSALINEVPIPVENNEIENKWKCLKTSILEAERISLPRKKKKKDKSWITKEILDPMDLRRPKKGTLDYHELSRRIKQLCKREKESWYNNMCEKIEHLEANHQIREMHENVKKLTNTKKNVQNVSDCIKDKNGKILFEKANVAKRWGRIHNRIVRRCEQR